jgi:hypothetical protein
MSRLDSPRPLGQPRSQDGPAAATQVASTSQVSEIAPRSWAGSRPGIAALVTWLAVSVGGTSRACEDCNAVLVGGVFDTIDVTRHEDATKYLRHFLATSSYEVVKKAIDAGLSVGIIAKAVPINIGANFDQDEFRRIQKQLAEEHVAEFTATSDLRVIVRLASPQILDAWTRVTQIRHGARSGLSARFDQRSGGKNIALMVSWIPTPGDNGSPIVTGLDIQGGDASPDLRFKSGDQLLIGIDSNIMVVKRDADKELRVTLATTKGSVTSLLPPEDQTCAGFGGSGNVRCSACGSKGYVQAPDEPDFVVKNCETCNGSAFVVCPQCSGGGVKPAAK